MTMWVIMTSCVGGVGDAFNAALPEAGGVLQDAARKNCSNKGLEMAAKARAWPFTLSCGASAKINTGLGLGSELEPCVAGNSGQGVGLVGCKEDSPNKRSLGFKPKEQAWQCWACSSKSLQPKAVRSGRAESAGIAVGAEGYVWP